MAQQIQISDELWRYLNSNKEPGETFEDVIIRVSKLKDKLKGASK